MKKTMWKSFDDGWRDSISFVDRTLTRRTNLALNVAASAWSLSAVLALGLYLDCYCGQNFPSEDGVGARAAAPRVLLWNPLLRVSSFSLMNFLFFIFKRLTYRVLHHLQSILFTFLNLTLTTTQ